MSDPPAASHMPAAGDLPPAESAAGVRIREAEERLREAIEELQRRQRLAGGGGGGHPPCDHPDESCTAHAVGNLCQSFLLSYGVRVGIGILLRAFKLARRKSYSSLLDLKATLFSVIINLIFQFLSYISSYMMSEEFAKFGIINFCWFYYSDILISDCSRQFFSYS